MKLFRLKSNQNSLLFEGDLNSNIILPEKSKIALLNVAFQKAINEIKLSVGNNIINFSIGTDYYSAIIDVYNDTLTTYTKSNITNLLIIIEDCMNKELSIINNYVIGGAWRISEDSSGKVELKFEQNASINIVEAKIKGYSNIGITDTMSSDITKTDATTHVADSALGVAQDGSKNYECFVSNYRYLVPQDITSTKVAGDLGGCGYVRAQIKAISTDAANNGFFIGLSSKQIAGFGGNFSVGRFLYAIYAKNTTTPYEYMNNTNSGAPIQAGFNPADDDLMEISLSDGEMVLTVYSTTHPTGRVIFSALNTFQNHVVYPYLVFYDQVGNSVASYEFTPINKTVTTTDIILSNQTLQGYNGGITPPLQELYVRPFSLDWSGFAPWYIYLGFEQVKEFFEYKTVTFGGENIPNFVDDTETYLVNINNQSVLSYDMSNDFKGRRNLLSVIQNIRNKSDPDMLFTTDTPIFIDLDNANPIMLKNLNLSIISALDNSRPAIIGYSNMTILIE